MTYAKRWFRNLLGNSTSFVNTWQHFEHLMNSFDDQIKHHKRTKKSNTLAYATLEFLATHGSNTPYKIADDLGVATSSLAKVISTLESDGFIRIVKRTRWRTKLWCKLYGMTSIGLSLILAFHKERMEEKFTIDQYPSIQRWFEKQIKINYLKQIVNKNRHLPFYNIFFRKWESMTNEQRDEIRRRIFNPSFALDFFESLLGFLASPKTIFHFDDDRFLNSSFLLKYGISENFRKFANCEFALAILHAINQTSYNWSHWLAHHPLAIYSTLRNKDEDESIQSYFQTILSTGLKKSLYTAIKDRISDLQYEISCWQDIMKALDVKT